MPFLASEVPVTKFSFYLESFKVVQEANAAYPLVPSVPSEKFSRGFTCAGIFQQSMGARNRVGIGLSYRPARLHNLAELVPWKKSILGLLKSFKQQVLNCQYMALCMGAGDWWECNCVVATSSKRKYKHNLSCTNNRIIMYKRTRFIV